MANKRLNLWVIDQRSLRYTVGQLEALDDPAVNIVLEHLATVKAEIEDAVNGADDTANLGSLLAYRRLLETIVTKIGIFLL